MAEHRQRRPRVRNSKYLAAIAQLPSVISGRWPVQVAHVRYGDADQGKPHTGMGEKPDDYWTLPLTPDEHADGVRAQHKSGEREWWQSHGIDPVETCLRLREAWERPGDDHTRHERMKRVITRARMKW